MVLVERYRIVRLLGQGGFGAVYRAWDLRLSSPCALKENLGTTPEAERQFNLEAMLLANLRHANLPGVIDYFSIPGQGQYLVMEFVEGLDLQEKLQQPGGPLPEGQVLPWINQVCDALIYLHSQNPPIIHRDIKPANIKITPLGLVKLVDFGIAKVYDPARKTALGARAITPGFSPPEQYGRGVTDARTDIYGLGATLYITLTGHPPVESLQRLQGVPLPDPHLLNPAIEYPTVCAIKQALELEPEQRFQRVAELKAALVPPAAPAGNAGRFAGPVPVPEPAIPAAPPAPFAAPAPARSRRWLFLGFGAAIIFCLLCSVVGVWAFNNDPFSIFASPTATRRPAATSIRTSPTATLFASQTPTRVQFTSTATVSPTRTATQRASLTPTQPAATWKPCPGIYASRLHVNDQAYVSNDPPLKNNVRALPGRSEKFLGQIKPGERIVILEGPACADSMVWWRIRSLQTGLTGWTSEGDRNDYWLVPEK